jgi:hypothetical protein
MEEITWRTAGVPAGLRRGQFATTDGFLARDRRGLRDAHSFSFVSWRDCSENTTKPRKTLTRIPCSIEREPSDERFPYWR